MAGIKRSLDDQLDDKPTNNIKRPRQAITSEEASKGSARHALESVRPSSPSSSTSSPSSRAPSSASSSTSLVSHSDLSNDDLEYDSDETTSSSGSSTITSSTTNSGPSSITAQSRDDKPLAQSSALEDHSTPTHRTSPGSISPSSSSDDDLDPEIPINVRPLFNKPIITNQALSLSSTTELRNRIQNLLPALRVANESLTTSNSIEADLADDEPHIEMDLGLGVLEEKVHGDKSDSESDSSEESSEGVVRDKSVLGRLMGRKCNESPSLIIEEVLSPG
ncbi:MAG: hypothetical protein M1825_005981 [Sarcosagium campestre]|nr:MAG: hypothetical protein M1825_005981 [Sarcosagium campestre]